MEMSITFREFSILTLSAKNLIYKSYRTLQLFINEIIIINLN